MLKRYGVWVILGAFLAAYLIYSTEKEASTINSLTYFPRDPAIQFLTATTSLRQSPNEKGTSGYTVHWTTQSEINHPVYLRQDVSLLFQNGKLIQINNHWKQQVKALTFSKSLSMKKEGYFEALTDHYAESHPKDSEIKSQDVMSWDHLYVRTKGLKNPESFTYPTKKQDNLFKDKLTTEMEARQTNLLNQATRTFQLKPEEYDVFPLNHLVSYQNNPLPGLTEETSHRVISELWEGLYKNYILGIHEKGRALQSPIGSDMPLILYKKSGDQLLVLIRSKSGQLFVLKQMI
ncbi:MAG TPA: hypothetical protein VLK78_07310 [Candidatus Angelobacter sp.]|nr:hypothetical protein [Candidatus Angelobacter sp.]